MKYIQNNKYIISAILSLFLSFIFCIPNKTIFKVNGDEKSTVLWNEKYHELGAQAKRCSFVYCQRIKKEIKITGNVDTSKIGEYTINYSLKYKGKKYSIQRKVVVTEKEAPVIELVGQKELVCQGKKYVEQGFTAKDNYDGDITDKVIVKELKDGIHYSVTDSAKNKTEVIRKRSYEDNEMPVIKLKGDETIYISQGKTFTDPGFSAFDNCDGDLTKKVVAKENVNTNKTGDYRITYSVSDSVGNTTFKERKIVVYSFDTTNKEAYITALNQYIKEKNYKVSIIYYNLDSKYIYKYNENKVYYGASLIKTLAAMYAYEKMDVTDKLRTYIKPMIEKSNNQAYLNLESIIGFNNLKNYGLSLGAKYTLVGGDEFGDTTAEDQLVYWLHLYEIINSHKLKNEIKGYFINDFHKHLNFDGAPTIMHKYGYYNDVFHDVGIVFDKSPYIIIILTQEANNNYAKIISDLSQKIYKLNQL